MLLSAPRARMTLSVTLLPPAQFIFVCHGSSQRSKNLILDITSLQSNRNIKCEILKYARCWLCDTDHWGSQVCIVTAEIWNAHYTPDDASGSVLTVCRPLIGHSVQTLPSHWLIKWWILFTLGTKEKMMSSKNVWVDNIHECLGMKTRMAISQFYSDPVPRTRTWLLTRTGQWITITGGAWH